MVAAILVGLLTSLALNVLIALGRAVLVARAHAQRIPHASVGHESLDRARSLGGYEVPPEEIARWAWGDDRGDERPDVRA